MPDVEDVGESSSSPPTGEDGRHRQPRCRWALQDPLAWRAASGDHPPPRTKAPVDPDNGRRAGATAGCAPRWDRRSAAERRDTAPEIEHQRRGVGCGQQASGRRRIRPDNAAGATGDGDSHSHQLAMPATPERKTSPVCSGDHCWALRVARDRLHTGDRRAETRRQRGECFRIAVASTNTRVAPTAADPRVGAQQVALGEHRSRSLAVSSALDTSVTGVPIASWMMPDSSGCVQPSTRVSTSGAAAAPDTPRPDPAPAARW